MVAARHRSPTACAGLSPLAPRAPSEVTCNGGLCDTAIMSDPVPRVSLATDPPSLRDASVSAFPGVIPGHSGFFLFFCFCRNKSRGKSSGNEKTVITPFKLAVPGHPISPSRDKARLEPADTSHHPARRAVWPGSPSLCLAPQHGPAMAPCPLSGHPVSAAAAETPGRQREVGCAAGTGRRGASMGAAEQPGSCAGGSRLDVQFAF